MNISEWITGWAIQTPSKTALLFNDVETSYKQFEQRVDKVAKVLVLRGVERASRVAILATNCPDYLALVFACARIGATLVPLNWRLTIPEHEYQLAVSEPQLIFCNAEFAEHALTLRERNSIADVVCLGNGPPDIPCLDALIETAPAGSTQCTGQLADALLLIFTSGTTGHPKGAVLSQSAVMWNAVIGGQAHDFNSSDRVLTDLPLFHVGGLNIQTLPALHRGATVVIHERFDPDRALRCIAERAISVNLLVPPTMQALLDSSLWSLTDLSGLRLSMAGSSTVPVHLLQSFFDRGLTVGQVYGSTETCPIVIYLGAPDARTRIGSCGKPATHCEARIAGNSGESVVTGETGEILVRGPNLFSGYWRNEAATAENMIGDWFRTGDAGHQDEEGFFYVDDRIKDMIISGGENIYPAEIEQVLLQLDGVSECAVIGQPDDRWGEVPVAMIVPTDGKTVDPDNLHAHAQNNLARYKLPKKYVTKTSLPRNAMGKIQKFKLRNNQ